MNGSSKERPFRFCTPTVEANGATRFQLWEPNAQKVWLVSADGLDSHSMKKQSDGQWEISVPNFRGTQYGFVVQWVQELRHSGASQSQCYGVPPKPFTEFDGDMSEGEDGSAATPAAPGSNFSPGQVFADVEAAEAAESSPKGGAVLAGSPRFARKSPAELLGKAEFLIEMDDMSCLISDAEGSRLSLYAAHRMQIVDVSARPSDGSWGPVPLSCLEKTAEDSVDPQSLRVWSADIAAVHKDSPVIVQVTRRDWRVDPYSLALVKGPETSQDDVIAKSSLKVDSEELGSPPVGPLLWSTLPPTLPEPVPYSRCPDWELVLYELHVGSFTPEGTLKAATAKLKHVRSLGCTALSVMPVHQDFRRMKTDEADMWGYDVISFCAIDSTYGTTADLIDFVAEAHAQGLVVFIDVVFNHMMWGSDSYFGTHYFIKEMDTPWGPRPDFSLPEVRKYVLDSIEFCLAAVGFDGVRVDSTKSIRKLPNGADDSAGARLLGDVSALCRRYGRVTIAEDLEDGDGVLQFGGLGFHFQWDMALFCWVYNALVSPWDEHRDMQSVVRGLQGLCPWRGHALRGRVIFMESHDTATSDRYGRVPAAVHNGKSFIPAGEGEGGGDAFQKAEESLPYPEVSDVEGNAYAARRAALGLVILMTAPGVPMLLQGQELCDCRPFKWPRGPGLDWELAGASSGQAAEWRKLCKNLIRLRIAPAPGLAGEPRPGPLAGDGLHVYHSNGGVLAYLRWAELSQDSRQEDATQPALVLVIVNCTNNSFMSYELGVPPSKTWSLALTSLPGAGAPTVDVNFSVVPNKPSNGFPCSISLSLAAYSAMVLQRQS
eukprot:TRINITY_DN14895_c0_g1_i1.p1 TRINITY_DN14895_c0_g1~~TRINITY_DN14895_c0_g1_i1.p1  ORF type:complete len:846 (+),score=136.02 TRINITY_DN14895_c0_g1_i1:60-2540(+)